MRFFHLSDLHLGIRLLGRDLREDQEAVLGQVVRYAREYSPDAIVIAGDVYDKALPSAEAVELFDQFLDDLREAAPEAAVMIISGNHDSAPRLDLYRGQLKKQGIYVIGNPPCREGEHIECVTLADEYGLVNFYLLPFVRPSVVRELVGSDEKGNLLSYDETLRRLLGRESLLANARRVLVSHQFYLPVGANAAEAVRSDAEIVTVGNIDQVRADVLAPFDYAALGHIHRAAAVGEDRFRYAGTPMAVSVSEADQEKGLLLVELGKKGDAPKIETLPLVPPHRIRAISGTREEVLAQPSDDYISVRLEGEDGSDAPELRARLDEAFPNLLEVRWESRWQANYREGGVAPLEIDPYSLTESFLGDTDEETKKLLKELFHEIQGV
ncbi:MAG: exonuclease SbcCD subunit D [Lachnospiraceae bacterium]